MRVVNAELSASDSILGRSRNREEDDSPCYPQRDRHRHWEGEGELLACDPILCN